MQRQPLAAATAAAHDPRRRPSARLPQRWRCHVQRGRDRGAVRGGGLGVWAQRAAARRAPRGCGPPAWAWQRLWLAPCLGLAGGRMQAGGGAPAHLHPRPICPAAPHHRPPAGRLTGQATGFLYRARAKFFKFAEDTEVTKARKESCSCSLFRSCSLLLLGCAPAEAAAEGGSMPALVSAEVGAVMAQRELAAVRPQTCSCCMGCAGDHATALSPPRCSSLGGYAQSQTASTPCPLSAAAQLHEEMQATMYQLNAIRAELQGGINLFNPGCAPWGAAAQAALVCCGGAGVECCRLLWKPNSSRLPWCRRSLWAAG